MPDPHRPTLNRVILGGTLMAPPLPAKDPAGRPACVLKLRCEVPRRPRKGRPRAPRVDVFAIRLVGPVVPRIVLYLPPGRQVVVEGRLRIARASGGESRSTAPGLIYVQADRIELAGDGRMARADASAAELP
jgi:single-stranded DNA-binding protein